MNEWKEDLLTQLMQTAGEAIPKMPEMEGFAPDMHPWEVILKMKHRLPKNEQKIVELIEKLGEVKELLDEVYCKN